MSGRPRPARVPPGPGPRPASGQCHHLVGFLLALGELARAGASPAEEVADDPPPWLEPDEAACERALSPDCRKWLEDGGPI